MGHWIDKENGLAKNSEVTSTYMRKDNLTLDEAQLEKRKGLRTESQSI